MRVRRASSRPRRSPREPPAACADTSGGVSCRWSAGSGSCRTLAPRVCATDTSSDTNGPVPGAALLMWPVVRGAGDAECAQKVTRSLTPGRALEQELVPQPPRAGEHGDQTAHRRRRCLPQPRCCGSPARLGLRPTMNGKSPDRRYLSEAPCPLLSPTAEPSEEVATPALLRHDQHNSLTEHGEDHLHHAARRHPRR